MPFRLKSLRELWVRKRKPAELASIAGLIANADNYLHEGSQANDPPSGTFYRPNGDGVRLASLGVHEHWNNATQKQYSRNLGTAIELKAPSRSMTTSSSTKVNPLSRFISTVPRWIAALHQSTTGAIM